MMLADEVVFRLRLLETYPARCGVAIREQVGVENERLRGALAVAAELAEADKQAALRDAAGWRWWEVAGIGGACFAAGIVLGTVFGWGASR